MRSESPVLTEKEVEFEQVVALGQTEYYPIIVCRYRCPDGSIWTATRFRFTDKEREAIAKGADLILSQPHHGPMTPIATQFAFPGEYALEGLE